MKPTTEAIEAAIRYLEAPMSAREQMEQILTAAYAAQFPPNEDYAGFVDGLREWAGQYEGITLAGEEIIGQAADAIETVLAERDALKAELAAANKRAANRLAVEAERDALAARLAPVGDEPRHLTTDEQKVFHSALRRSAKIKKPVDDEALVEIAVQAGYKAEYEADMSVGQAEAIFVETVYKPLSIYKPIMTAAIAAIRPHIEAAERERCAKAVEKVAERINVAHHERSEWEDGYLQGVHDAAAAIRSGK